MAIQVDCSVPPELTLSRPDPEGVPTEMTVGAYLLDLQDINDAEQTFSADFFFVMAWRDERLLHVEGRSLAGCRLPAASVSVASSRIGWTFETFRWIGRRCRFASCSGGPGPRT
jgi:hypothetical protein